jgi:hypothetical protein
MAGLLAALGLGSIVGYTISESGELDALTGKPTYNILAQKNPENLSKDTRAIIDMITIQDNINPVGSMKFKIQKYPGDIDLFEVYKTCCDLDSARKDVAKSIQKVVKRIRDDPEVFFGDFKAGLDDRYKLDLGEIDYLNHRITGYDRDAIVEDISSMFTRGLLTSDEYAEIIFLVNQDLTFARYEEIEEFFKEKRKVRWAQDEIIAGKKYLPLGVELTLEDAVAHKTIIKMDVWGKIQGGRFTEVTNFFLFVFVDVNGDEHVLNLELGDLIDSFMEDIIMYSTLEHKKSMKVAKRMWQLSTYIDFAKMLEELAPLFESDIGLLNQIAGDIEVLRFMLDKVDVRKLPLEEMIREIDEFKSRLSNFQDVELDDKLIYLLIDNITEHYEKVGKKVDVELIIKNLQYLEDYLLELVEIYADEYLKARGIGLPMMMDYVKKYRKEKGI